MNELEELLALLEALAGMQPAESYVESKRSQQSRALRGLATREQQEGGDCWMHYATDEKIEHAWKREHGTDEERAVAKQRDVNRDLSELQGLLEEVSR
jgi:hypothetical protein